MYERRRGRRSGARFCAEPACAKRAAGVLAHAGRPEGHGRPTRTPGPRTPRHGSPRARPQRDPGPDSGTGTVTVTGVCWLFIFKDTEQSPLQDSSSVRQQGGLPGPPPRSPRPRIHRRPGVLPLTAQHYCPVVSGPNCFQALGSSPGLLQSPML